MNENQLRHGATPTGRNPSVPLMVQVAMDTAPFDWNAGTDAGKLVTKNQGPSSSCGGQMASYGGEVLTGVPKSAKYPYTNIHGVGGGSTEPDITNFVKTKGLCDESVYPSYYMLNGMKGCDETFMTDSKGITPEVIADGKKHLFGQEIYVKRNIESIAQAIRDHGFCFIGIAGKNNGTWLSAFPKPPDEPMMPNGHFNFNLWYHWVIAKKASVINGIKYITIKNSWGDMVGEQGEQHLDASYEPFIFSAFTFARFVPPPDFHHTFNVDMRSGNSGPEVKALQDALKIDGEFSQGQVSTGYFGSVTLTAVKAFQKKYGIPSTGNVLTLTRAQLNKLFS